MKVYFCILFSYYTFFWNILYPNFNPQKISYIFAHTFSLQKNKTTKQKKTKTKQKHKKDYMKKFSKKKIYTIK
jgi:hypothetical protein